MKKRRFRIVFGIWFTAVLLTQISCGKLDVLTNSSLETHRNLWRENKIENYKMTVEIQKTGHATPNGKFIITVRGGIAKSIKPFDKPDVEMLETQMRFAGFDTVEAVFRFIESAENEGKNENRTWNRRNIEYDSKLGYPKKVDLDQSGVMDDELYFEVLKFEILESTDDKLAEKTSSPKVISVPAAEITKAEFSVRSHVGPLVGSDESYTTSGGMSFSSDGTAFRFFGSKNYDTGKKQNEKGQKFQGVASAEQFQKFAQTLAENDFSNLEDSTERITDTTDYTLIITYAGKTKTIKTSNTGKDTAEVKAILDAFETLKNQIEWQEIK